MRYNKNKTTGQKTLTFKVPLFLGNFLDLIPLPFTYGTDYYPKIKKFVIYI